MKKSQLPEDIRIHCPDGLSDEQVEAWLLGYLASNPQSTGQGGEEQTDRDFIARQSDDNATIAPTTEKPEAHKELQDPQSDEAAPSPSQSSTDAPVFEIGEKIFIPSGTLIQQSETDKDRISRGRTDNWVINTALVLGCLCVPFFEFGLLTFAGIIFSAWATVRCRRQRCSIYLVTVVCDIYRGAPGGFPVSDLLSPWRTVSPAQPPY